MSRNRPNITQRSWDNYEGDKAIESWKKQGFYKESARHSSDGDDNYIPEGYERDPITGKLKKKRSVKEILEDKPKEEADETPAKTTAKSKLKESLDSVRGFTTDESADEEKPSWRSQSTAGPVRADSEKDDGSMLPSGYKLDDQGRVVNKWGHADPEDWYTIDEETGKKRRKNLSERPMYIGQTDYNSFFS